MNKLLKQAYTPRPVGEQSTWKPLGVTKPGVYDATFVGFTPPIERWNQFEPCKRCHGAATLVAGCEACNGTGHAKRTVTYARYVLPDGSEEREEMVYRLSRGDGRYSPSKLYVRASQFTGIEEPDMLADMDWDQVSIPVRLVVRPSGAKQFLRITDVLPETNPMAPVARPLHPDPDEDLF